jgi:hypothetical protein
MPVDHRQNIGGVQTKPDRIKWLRTGGAKRQRKPHPYIL